MRNFWLDGRIDGRKTPVTGGPRGAGGGFDLTIRVRENGESRPAVRIKGWVNRDDPEELFIRVYADSGGELIEGDGLFTLVSPR